MKITLAKNLMKKKAFKIIFAFFIFILFANLHAADIQCVWTDVEKIIAVGDLHGDYENFVKILKGTELIDQELHWIGGQTHLVQNGDIMDRGPDAKKIFDLLMKLEKEAEAAGGRVHMLIGNHEEMNITGIAFDYVGYVTVEQFLSFIPDKYREKKEKKFIERIAKKAGQETGSNSSLDLSLRKNWEQLIRNDREARRKYTINFNEKYGKWILEHNAVIKINDIVFAHGGISEKYSTWKLEEINNLLRKELNTLRKAFKDPRPSDISFQPQIAYSTDGPLWYRDLALEEEEVLKQEVDRILSNLGAHYMVVAHTVKIHKVISAENISRFQGRIWDIDTGISDYYGSNLSALIIENGKFSVWRDK